MRIGFFTSIEGWGGSELYLKTLMLALRQLGHDPVLIGVEGSRLFKDLQAEGVECVAWNKVSRPPEDDIAASSLIPHPSSSIIHPRGFKSLILGMLPGWFKLLAGNVKEVRHLRHILTGLNLDIAQVTVHGYEVAGIAARLCGIPVIAVYQISPTPEPFWFRRFLIRWTARTYHRVCFVSRYSAIEWQKITGLKSDRCEVVPNGADLRLYEKHNPSFAQGRKESFKLISVGRLHPMKGYHYLIEAMAELKDSTVSLDILGEGGEEAGLRDLARRLGVETIVHFRGHGENPDAYLKKADCFVLASVSHEGSPFVLAEAMAASLPLITSDYGPLPEINIHNETGLVVPMRDSQALAGAIRLLRVNSELVSRMGIAGRKRATKYDQWQMVAKMIEIYFRQIRKLASK